MKLNFARRPSPYRLPRWTLLAAVTGAWTLVAAAPSVPAAEPVIVIAGCAVFVPESGAMVSERTVVVRGEQILAVLGPGEAFETPLGALCIDGRGKFVLPGLIDAHVHLVHVLNFAHVTGDEVLPLYLAAGVTSVRSTGDEIVAATLVADLPTHPESSPRVFTCSPLLDAEPPIHRDVGRAVTDPAQVPALLDDLLKWNVSTVKIYAGTGRHVGRAIIDEGIAAGCSSRPTWGAIRRSTPWPMASTAWSTFGPCSTTSFRRKSPGRRAIEEHWIWTTRSANRSSRTWCGTRRSSLRRSPSSAT